MCGSIGVVAVAGHRSRSAAGAWIIASTTDTVLTLANPGPLSPLILTKTIPSLLESTLDTPSDCHIGFSISLSSVHSWISKKVSQSIERIVGIAAPQLVVSLFRMTDFCHNSLCGIKNIDECWTISIAIFLKEKCRRGFFSTLKIITFCNILVEDFVRASSLILRHYTHYLRLNACMAYLRRHLEFVEAREMSCCTSVVSVDVKEGLCFVFVRTMGCLRVVY